MVTETWLPVTNFGEENCDSLTCTNQQSTNNRNDLFPYFSLSLSVSSSISLANNNMISAALRQFCHHTFRVYYLLLARWLKYDTVSYIHQKFSYNVLYSWIGRWFTAAGRWICLEKNTDTGKYVIWRQGCFFYKHSLYNYRKPMLTWENISSKYLCNTFWRPRGPKSAVALRNINFIFSIWSGVIFYTAITFLLNSLSAYIWVSLPTLSHSFVLIHLFSSLFSFFLHLLISSAIILCSDIMAQKPLCCMNMPLCFHSNFSLVLLFNHLKKTIRQY